MSLSSGDEDNGDKKSNGPWATAAAAGDGPPVGTTAGPSFGFPCASRFRAIRVRSGPFGLLADASGDGPPAVVGESSAAAAGAGAAEAPPFFRFGGATPGGKGFCRRQATGTGGKRSEGPTVQVCFGGMWWISEGYSAESGREAWTVLVPLCSVTFAPCVLDIQQPRMPTMRDKFNRAEGWRRVKNDCSTNRGCGNTTRSVPKMRDNVRNIIYHHTDVTMVYNSPFVCDCASEVPQRCP